MVYRGQDALPVYEVLFTFAALLCCRSCCGRPLLLATWRPPCSDAAEHLRAADMPLQAKVGGNKPWKTALEWDLSIAIVSFVKAWLPCYPNSRTLLWSPAWRRPMMPLGTSRSYARMC